jgi:hypothetical protein
VCPLAAPDNFDMRLDRVRFSQRGKTLDAATFLELSVACTIERDLLAGSATLTAFRSTVVLGFLDDRFDLPPTLADGHDDSG